MKRLTAVVLTVCSCLLAGAFPDKPAVEGPVNDYAGILDASQTARLQHMLVDFADSTSTQICVVTVSDLEGMSVSDYAIRLGLEWKVGSDEFDNGAVLLVKPRTENSYGEAFIAVGRGLEGAIPDIVCHRIINDIAIPYFRNDDYYGGIRASCLKIMELADDEYHSPAADDGEDDTEAVIIALVFLVLLAVVVTLIAKAENNSRNNGGSGGSSGGRGGRRPVVIINPGRGSFSGGSFGGGGFSGGFSGGFGGGSFGGGGGGGRW